MHDWSLPDPVVSLEARAPIPRPRPLLADAVGLALLVVLDPLTPPERLAFVLHDVFAVPFDEIATMVGRSPAAARQLASRARRRVRGATPTPTPTWRPQRRIVDALHAAVRAGDLEAVVELLDQDVVLRVDPRPGRGGGPAGSRARRAVAREVARARRAVRAARRGR